MEPDRRVYNVHTRRTQKGQPDPDWTADVQRRWYGDRVISNSAELAGVKGPWVYVGFEQAFPVANLRWLASFVPSAALRTRLDRDLGRMSPRSQIRESWLWENPAYHFVPLAETEHYRAFRVETAA